MPLKMTTVSRKAAAILDELTASLDVGESRKIDRGLGYMAVHVECLHPTELGLHYSVAHYHQQNGDLVPDPDVVFVYMTAGWTPISFQNSIGHRAAVRFEDDGTIEVDEHQHEELVRFCNLWMKNISEQQGLPTRRAR